MKRDAALPLHISDQTQPHFAAPAFRRERDFPYWLVTAALIALFVAVTIATNNLYGEIFSIVLKGLWITIFVSLASFAAASLIGLGLALMALSKSTLLRQVARFYVEIIRAVPVLVLLFWIAFAGAPILVATYNLVTSPLQTAGLTEPMQVRDLSLMLRAIIALTISYSAFIAEIFRAGIQAVDQGQMEAAKALGLRPFQRFRLIILPQAIRTIMPPLGNDFMAMIKDSSLVSVLGVADVTQMAKIYAAGSFRFFETYSILAYIYLILTISLSLCLRWVEKRLRQGMATGAR